MSGAILAFPCETAQLELKGYTLIAWRRGSEGCCFHGEEGWLHGLWKPADGKGWYRNGWYDPEIEIGAERLPAFINDFRATRSRALWIWKHRIREPYGWHYLMSEAQAFPPKHRRYLRPPRAPRMLAHA